MVAHTKSITLTLIAMVVTDIGLLLIMLVGLLHLRRHGGGTFGVTHLLWKQGVYWLLLATATGVLPAVFNVLDSNDELSPIFQAPALITMAIAGSRMHRSLVDFSSRSFGVHETSVFMFPTAKRTHAILVPLNRMGPTVGATFEQHPAPQTSLHDFGINTDEVHEDSEALRERVGTSFQVDDDVESGIKK